MPKIEGNIAQIRSATYGRDVREAIASGLEAWDSYNAQTLAAIESADTKLTQSQSTLNAIETANANAITNKRALDTVVSDATAIKTALNTLNTVANATKSELSTANGTAVANKTALDATNATATTKHDALQALVNDAASLADMRATVDRIPGEVLGTYFGLGRTGKLYQTKVPKFASSQTSACTKLLDNAGMICTPSTDTTKGQDDYQDSGELLFKWWHCNYVRDADGFARPVALEGDADYKTSGHVDVGTLCPTFYYSYKEKADHYLLTVSDSPNDVCSLKPFEAAIRQDGTVEPFFILSSYMSSETDGKLYSQPGKATRAFMSYNACITEYQKKGPGYHGAGYERNLYQIIWQLIKYATKNSQNIFYGCVSKSWQYEAAVQRSAAKTVFPVTTTQAETIEVGDMVYVGYPSGMSGSNLNIDRGQATMRALSGGDIPVMVIGKKAAPEAGVVDIELDLKTGFTTTDRTAGMHVYLSFMGRPTGDTDAVMSRYDGSKTSNSDGAHSYRVQGVEYSNGFWFIPSDIAVEVKNTDYTRDIYRADRWATRYSDETNIRAKYKKVATMQPPAGATNQWGDYWIGDIGIAGGVAYPAAPGTGNSVGHADYCYNGGEGAGMREMLCCGSLGSWSISGSVMLRVNYWLGTAYWSHASAD